ncbi:MAG: hypothetical protein GY801_40715 [bacterium]|nr:hypothetical protein [bacterium]
MKKRRLLVCVFGSLALLIGLSTGNCAQAEEILIIVHIDVGVEELAQKTISEIYLGTRTKWDDELTIRVAMLKKGETHEQFTKKIVKTTPSKLKSFWKKVVFTGIGTPPKIFKKEDDLVEFVAETEGAIGYITKETSHEEVKTVSIVDTE